MVWCRLVLGHLPDLDAAYAELARVCARGGHVVVTDFHPDAAEAGHRRTFRDGDGVVQEVEHHVHTPREHRRAAARAGLTLVQRFDRVVGRDGARLLRARRPPGRVRAAARAGRRARARVRARLSRAACACSSRRTTAHSASRADASSRPADAFDVTLSRAGRPAAARSRQRARPSAPQSLRPARRAAVRERVRVGARHPRAPRRRDRARTSAAATRRAAARCVEESARRRHDRRAPRCVGARVRR